MQQKGQSVSLGMLLSRISSPAPPASQTALLIRPFLQCYTSCITEECLEEQNKDEWCLSGGLWGKKLINHSLPASMQPVVEASRGWHWPCLPLAEINWASLAAWCPRKRGILRVTAGCALLWPVGEAGIITQISWQHQLRALMTKWPSSQKLLQSLTERCSLPILALKSWENGKTRCYWENRKCRRLMNASCSSIFWNVMRQLP